MLTTLVALAGFRKDSTAAYHYLSNTYRVDLHLRGLQMSLALYQWCCRYRLLLFLAGVACCFDGHSFAQTTTRKSVFGPVEHEVKSEYSHIRIRKTKKYRTMMFVKDDGSEVGETVINIKQPHKLVAAYTQTMFTSLLFKQQQKRVLIVGLGGGSMIHFLQHHQPKTMIDVVEIDAKVVDIANKYFDIKESKTVKIITEDAFTFFPKCKQKYDAIYMDAFLKPSENTDNTGVPLQLKTKTFLKSLQQNLTEDGLILFNLNIGNSTKEDIKTIQQVYPNTYVFSVPKSESVVLLVSLSEERKKKSDLAPVARVLDRKFRANFSFRKMLRNLKQ